MRIRITLKVLHVVGGVGSIASLSALLTGAAELAHGNPYSVTGLIAAGVVAASVIAMLVVVYAAPFFPGLIDVDSGDEWD